MAKNIPNGRKIYKYTFMYYVLFISRPSQIYHIGDFWCANMFTIWQPLSCLGDKEHSLSLSLSLSLGMFSVFWYLFSILIKLTFCCKILWFSGNWYQAISHPLQEFTQDYIGFEFRMGLKVFREIIALVYIELICNVGLI
jgi:hypothetical protein